MTAAKKPFDLKQQYEKAVRRQDPKLSPQWQSSKRVPVEGSDQIRVIGSIRINGLYTGMQRREFTMKRLEPAPEPKQGGLL
jgi:hypothetical protein